MFRSIIAIAALMVCSGAWAELTEVQRDRFSRLGSCISAYMYAAVRSFTGDESVDADDAIDRINTLTPMAESEAAELANAGDGVEAGVVFQQSQSGDMSWFHYVARSQGDRAAEIERLQKIINYDCENLFPDDL